MPVLQLDSSWQQFRGVGQGLENQGATCYINSVVQCLVHNPILANLSFGGLRQTCKCLKCALCYLAFRVRCSFDSSNVSRERVDNFPRWMIVSGLATLGTLSRDRLSATKQEDAHDFLRQWLDKVHDLHEKILNEGLPSKQRVYTVIDQVFGGVLASRVQCQHCGQVSSMYDSMNDLSVEVDSGLYGVVKSVEIALAKFIQPEVLSGDNAYHCDWCQRKQTAHKSLHIHTAPNTLTLHLKRFRPDFVKLTGHIAFPLTLNLAPFLSPDSPEAQPAPAFPQQGPAFAQKGPAFSQPNMTYRLIGVLVHKGSWSSAGHYFSYVLDSDDQWWLMNDELRCKASTDEVLNRCEAYMLFYIRNHPRQGPPFVPPSHVDQPTTKKRCLALSSMDNGYGVRNADTDSVPPAKRLNSQQQQHLSHAKLSSVSLPRRLDPVLADTHYDSQHPVQSSSLLSHVAAYARNSAADADAADDDRLHSRTNGHSHSFAGSSAIPTLTRQGPQAAAQVNGHSQASANGHFQGADMQYDGHSTGQLGMRQQLQDSADEPSWLAAHDPHGADANGSSQGNANGQIRGPVAGPAGQGNDPQRFGFSGFSLSKAGQALPKQRPPTETASTMPQLQSGHSSAPAQLPEGDPQTAAAGEQQPLVRHPGQAVGEAVSKAGHKRARPDSLTEADQDLELVLEEDSQPGPIRPQAIGSQQTHITHASKQQQQQQQPSYHQHRQSNELPSLHHRTAAPSFLGRKQPSWRSMPTQDVLSSDAPPHIKYAPSHARKQLHGKHAPPSAQAQPPLQSLDPSQHNRQTNTVCAANGTDSRGPGSLPAAAQTATGAAPSDTVARDAFPMAFGSNKKSGTAQHTWQARADPAQMRADHALGRVNQTQHRPSHNSTPLPSAPVQLNQLSTAGQAKPGCEASASSDQRSTGHISSPIHPASLKGQSYQVESGAQNSAVNDGSSGLGQAEQQGAAKTNNGSSRPGSGSKSGRKPGVLGRMKSAAVTMTNWLQSKPQEQPSDSQELHKLAELYPSDDCSD